MRNSRKVTSILIAAAMIAALGAGCGNTEKAPAGDTANDVSQTASQAEATPVQANIEKPYIAVISKGFKHQFWQVVNKGAQDAAAKYNVDITFDGPPTESDISIQVDMLNSAIAKNPKAIALAALDTESVTTQLNDCKSKKIPIIGFDSGVPNAPEGGQS